MKIIDCFPFFNELELLELRLAELYPWVDYFVIAEANKTHTNHPKDFNFEQNKDRYQPYLDKIVYIKVEDMPDSGSESETAMWRSENFQRNALMRGLEQIATPGDTIMVSDADEIPNKDAVMNILSPATWVVLKQQLFYYYVNCRVRRNWGGTVVASYGTFDTPQSLRECAKRHGVGFYPPSSATGGWHYSTLVGGNEDRLFYKTQNTVDFYADHHITDSKVAAERMSRLQDIYLRKVRHVNMEIVDITDTKPSAMDKFLEKYPQFFYEGWETV